MVDLWFKTQISKNLNSYTFRVRTRSVGEIFVKNGNIYYWGAGESQPIADNNDEVARAKTAALRLSPIASKSEIIKYTTNVKVNPVYFTRVIKTPKIANKTPSKSKNMQKQQNSSSTFDEKVINTTNSNIIAIAKKTTPKITGANKNQDESALKGKTFNSVKFDKVYIISFQQISIGADA